MRTRPILLAALLATLLTSAARAGDTTVAEPKIHAKSAAPSATSSSGAQTSGGERTGYECIDLRIVNWT